MQVEASSSWLKRNLTSLDTLMAHGPWYPRLIPFFVWMAMMVLNAMLMQLSIAVYPWVYTLQCVLVLALLWRYRTHLPELTLHFHWLAIPTALFLTVTWIALGWLMTGEFALRWQALMQGEPLGPFPELFALGHEPNWLTDTQTHAFEQMQAHSGLLYWSSIALRALGMVVVVAMFEEIFSRSLCLRALHRMRGTAVGIAQILEDMPLIGDWIASQPKLEKQLSEPHTRLTTQFHKTALGQLSIFGVAASTLIFMLNHIPRDWPACIVCGLVWCWLVWYTNRPPRNGADQWDPKRQGLGLGPVIWSHGLTNALLLAYVVWSGDWQFL